MNQSQNDIDLIIGKAISGNATVDEISKLNVWKSYSPENQKIYDKSLQAWKKSESWISETQIVADKVAVQRAMNKSLSLQLHKLKRNSQLLKIAAVLALPIALAISWFVLNTNVEKNTAVQLCQISAPKGHISKCTLPDGSEVWVNTNSSITYNTATFNTQNREIKVSGEAFFKVTKNKDRPFVVENDLAKIVVTGTQFNVKAYPNTDCFETVLAEGSIELHLNKGSGQVVDLVPGECAVFNSSERKISIREVDPNMYTSWRVGEILFKDATLNDLIVELERIYDIQFYMKNKNLGNYRFRGMFSYNNNLIDALEKIKKTAGVDYYIENKKVWLTQNLK